MATRLRIGARPSALALAQAEHVRQGLERLVEGLAVEVIPIRTSGDRLTTASLARVGGKGLFIRELEQALLADRIDLAVHSMKDLPAVLSAEFRIAAVPKREDSRDALITREPGGWAALKPHARLGTASARRRLEALRMRPDLEVIALRGNVDTRLARLVAGDFAAIVLAMAGLKRLGRITGLNLAVLDEREFLPAAGQGALAIEALAEKKAGGSTELEQAIAALEDAAARVEVEAERAFLATIGASCVSPVGIKGRVDSDDTLSLHALLFSPDGSKSLGGEACGSISLTGRSIERSSRAAVDLGVSLGREMIERGARDLIRDE
jgi:hydroxymethylbilane synthase